MDGIKRVLKYSLQAKISLWLSLGLIGTALVAGAVSFCIAFFEANKIQDDQLKQMAMLVDRHNFSSDAYALKYLRKDLAEEDALISIQILGRGDSLSDRKTYKYFPDLPSALADGFHTISSKKEWRVFVMPFSGGQRLAVAQRTGYRNEIAFNSAIRTTVPILLLIPILSIIVFIVVRHMLHPVAIMAKEVDGKTQHDLAPLETAAIPTEIQPFALSINRLLAHVQQVLAMQRRFVADAAHELRSPLTALSLQIQSIDRSTLPDEAQERMIAMTQGMERSAALVTQLLSLARSQSVPAADSVFCAPRKVIHEVLEALVPLAREKQIDLGMIGEENPQLRVQEADVAVVARNLIDNAIRYTPAEGRVDVQLLEDAGQVCVVVIDTGTGIAPDEMPRVFDAFYRVAGHDSAGSGLGLSIVKSIMERVGGSIQLHTVCKEGGLQATACFPK